MMENNRAFMIYKHLKQDFMKIKLRDLKAY
jgi:hypothetical protein